MSDAETDDYPVRRVTLDLCEACIDGVGEECHTPGCDLYLHAVDVPILAAKDDIQSLRSGEDLPEPDRREDECGVSAGYDGPEVVLRVNVALIRDAADALQALRDRTGMKKVDIVNRALQLYEFIDAEQRKGSALLFRDKGGSFERVRFM